MTIVIPLVLPVLDAQITLCTTVTLKSLIVRNISEKPDIFMMHTDYAKLLHVTVLVQDTY